MESHTQTEHSCEKHVRRFETANLLVLICRSVVEEKAYFSGEERKAKD
jgi:hypothetical protein